MRKVLTVLFMVFMFITLTSHVLFLKSDTYFLGAQSPSELYLFNGTFDKSDNIITRDRIIDPKIIGPDYHEVPTDDDFYDRDDATFLQFVSGDKGTYVAGISTKSRLIELSASSFNDYLEHEGIGDILDQRRSKGIAHKDAREYYAKHVKAILQVEDKKTAHYATPLNYPVEFIPLTNPYELEVGDKISFKLISQGDVLPNQNVIVGSRNLQKGIKKDITIRTDERGEVNFTLENEGQWYLSTIHMIESDGADVDYVSNWATLTFGVQ